jgi:dihydropteroate synthase
MFTLNCKGRILPVSQPLVMGIINTTPDSFYKGSRIAGRDGLLACAEKMIHEGAAILDVGGQSTRPGSSIIPVDEEMKRVLPAIEAIHKRFPEQLISIDTFYGRVAREAIMAGASMVNDISAGTLDEELLPAVAEAKVPYVLMHMKGRPFNMQQHPQYENVTMEVFDFLLARLSELTLLGIHDVIVDPGFGFGKNASHNFQLLRQMRWLQQLGRPLMAGLSRKGMIYRSLGITPEDALNGTTVMNTLALLNGASFLRVHDVQEAIQAVRLMEVYKQKEQS